MCELLPTGGISGQQLHMCAGTGAGTRAITDGEDDGMVGRIMGRTPTCMQAPPQATPVIEGGELLGFEILLNISGLEIHSLFRFQFTFTSP